MTDAVDIVTSNFSNSYEKGSPLLFDDMPNLVKKRSTNFYEWAAQG